VVGAASGVASIQDAFDETIGKLRSLIEQAVRAEQLRHQLTGLPNAGALDAELLRAIEGGDAFWIAFVEIDQFKRVNDKFGYERADALLRAVAGTLSHAAPQYFADQARAFHVHGDEFYILGRLTPQPFAVDAIDERLNTIRDSIAKITLSASEVPERMQCTVSIGWQTNDDGTVRDYQHRLELAVAHAKRAGRNRVARYDESMRKSQSMSSRSDCYRCKTTFSFDVPLDDKRNDEIWCPNCGARSQRPVHSRPAPDAKDITDVIVR
jgi:diguanylate cyclase (GGDEF)-like protein